MRELIANWQCHNSKEYREINVYGVIEIKNCIIFMKWQSNGSFSIGMIPITGLMLSTYKMVSSRFVLNNAVHSSAFKYIQNKLPIHTHHNFEILQCWIIQFSLWGPDFWKDVVFILSILCEVWIELCHPRKKASRVYGSLPFHKM